MCGIVAINNNNIKLLETMLIRVSHRGENELKFAKFAKFALGCTRLKIIDEKNGSQPFMNENDTVCAVFNGEIYNYKKLRSELQKSGHIFKSDCDTEILVHLYEEYGKDFLLKLDGMFAFILYDMKKESFFAARDFYGVKPLYYSIDKGAYYFASEMKAFEDLDVVEYSELLPGHYIEGERVVKYYNFTNNQYINENLKESCLKVRNLLESAVKKRVVTDLPVAIFFGGGIDSAIVLLLALKYHKNITPIIIGTDESEDVMYAKRMCKDLSLKFHHVQINLNELINLVPEAVYVTESFEPNVIRGSVLSLLLSKAAHDFGYKVVLCGEGSDEIFGGYGDFLNFNNEEDFNKHTNKLLNDLYRTQLLRVDRTSMYYTVEVREPFLDRELVEYALNIPFCHKVGFDGNGVKTTKLILREAFKDILPEYIYNRDKITLMEGAGTGKVNKNSGLLFENACKQVTDADFNYHKKKFPDYDFIDKEDVYNFKFFSKYYLKAGFAKNRVNNAQIEIQK